MNIQLFLFKLSMIFYYVLLTALVVSPVTIISVFSKQGGWKYGFTFIQNSLEVGLFGAFAIGFMLACYHALNFEMVGGAPLENYLKARQKVVVDSAKSIEELVPLIEKLPHRNLKVDGAEIRFSKLVRFMPPDSVVVTKLENGRYRVESRPFSSLLFMDFARNLKNVKTVANLLQA